jgi:hypothetical protein
MRLQGFFLIFLLFLIFSTPSLAETSPSVSALAHSPKWLALLHYKKDGSNYKSDAISPNFYVSSKGRIDPEAELVAMLEEIKHSPETLRGDESPICKFPARTLWLSAEFGIPVPRANCTMFEQFKNSLSAKAVSVVFSSYYLNNPSSAFGHTFLRLRRSEEQGDSNKSELLDYGINYAAIDTSNNAVIYALSGALGWFRGNFTKLPFYYKVREYSDFESRDLWFYNLNFSQAQVDELVRHIWELGQTEFDYYFFSANCSYQIMAALDAVESEWHFVERMSHLVVPAQTIRIIWDTPDLVKSVTYRVSNLKRFESHVGRLTTPEVAAFKKLIETKSPSFQSSTLSVSEQRDVLDAVIDYYDFEYSKPLLLGDSAASKEKQQFLIARAALAMPSVAPEVETPTDKEPHLGHGSSRASLMGGYGTSLKSFTDLSYRASFHDLLDQPDGYPDYAEIQVMDVRVRAYYQSFQPQLQKAALVENSSLTPIHKYSFPLSWKLDAGAFRLDEKDCPNCLAGQVLLAGGLTVEPVYRHLYTYLLLNAQETWATSFPGSKLRLGVGPTLGIRLQLTSKFDALSESTALYLFSFQPDNLLSTRLNLRYFPNYNYALGASYSLTDLESEMGLTYYVYF